FFIGPPPFYTLFSTHSSPPPRSSYLSSGQRPRAGARPPSQGGDETAYLDAFLDARVWAMKQEEAHSDTSRVDTAQRVFLRNGNLDLDPPLDWKVYGDSFHIG
ncbi:chitosanase, partial [Streptomyces sp. NPDC024062]|uniref:chitosanase n=1 Tax=Streptomyces sp. NPDC024062 TaxID=3156646 RepID=UPI00345545F2